MNAESDPHLGLEAPAMQSSATDTVPNSQEQDQHLRAQVELLRSPPQGQPPSNSTDDTREASHSHPPPSPGPSNGYEPQATSSQDPTRALSQRSEAEAFIHPELRAAHAHAPTASMMPLAPPSGHSPGSSNQSVSPNPALQPNPSSQPPNANLAPAPPQPTVSGGQDVSPDGRSRPKRELSQSKRAAQNRAAQRAFRQRKESYIRQLEQENKTYREMEKTFKGMQLENYALREYVITLQSRLLDVQGEFPTPPPNVNLSQPGNGSEARISDEHEQHGAGSTHINSGTPLEAVARAVAGLAAQEEMNQSQHQYPDDQEMKDEGPTEDTRTAEEINRHLQSAEAEPERASEV